VLAAPTRNAACGRLFEVLGDVRTPGRLRRRLQDARFRFDAPLDKGRTRRNKGTRAKPALYGRIHEEWTDREDTELALLVPAFRTGALGNRREGQ